MGAKPRESNWQDQQVTEAGIESFPASDPPSYNMPGRGNSGSHDAEPKDPAGERPAPGTVHNAMDRENRRIRKAGVVAGGAAGRIGAWNRGAVIAAVAVLAALVLWIVLT